MAIPILTISLSFNAYYKSKEYQEYLLKTSKLTQHLSGHYAKETLIDTFIEQVQEIFEVSQIGIYARDKENYFKEIKMFDCEKKQISSEGRQFEVTDTSVLQKIIEEDRILLFDVKKDAEKLVDVLSIEEMKKIESVMALPVKEGGVITGVILLMDRKKRAFRRKMLHSISHLVSLYFNTALDNAHYYEEVEQETRMDHLTRLMNLRGLEHTINEYYLKDKYRMSSLIMVDLDKFKPINDQYGHEAGNECIVQLSQYLKNEMEDIGSVARYGGDEFILFLPNTEAAEAEQIAIAIHEKLEEKEFTVTNYMSREREEVRLSMSGSFGVSEYHPDFKTIKEYIASADRVMYLHSKGNETNKVSVFRKGEYLTV